MWFGGRTSKKDAFNRDPHTESNTIPVMRFNLKKWHPYLEQLRNLISASKGSPVAVHTNAEASATLPAQLKQLADLREQGVLSDEEFAQAKAELLGS